MAEVCPAPQQRPHNKTFPSSLSLSPRSTHNYRKVCFHFGNQCAIALFIYYYFSLFGHFPAHPFAIHSSTRAIFRLSLTDVVYRTMAEGHFQLRLTYSSGNFTAFHSFNSTVRSTQCERRFAPENTYFRPSITHGFSA